MHLDQIENFIQTTLATRNMNHKGFSLQSITRNSRRVLISHSDPIIDTFPFATSVCPSFSDGEVEAFPSCEGRWAQVTETHQRLSYLVQAVVAMHHGPAFWHGKIRVRPRVFGVVLWLKLYANRVETV